MSCMAISRTAGATVTSMAPMHEHVQQRAGSQKQQRKPAEGMDAMLREKEEQGDCGECHERKRSA